MTTFGPSSALCFINNDTEFRSWAQTLHNALAAHALVQTSDTGQINLATVAKPGAINTVAGYEIWRFNDSLQATAPIFFKIEYGVGGTTTHPNTWFTVGTATNGAGTLLGVTTNRHQLSPTTAPTGTNKNVYSSGAANRIWLAYGIDWATNSFSTFIIVERTKDATGVDTADGFMMMLSNGSSTVIFQSALFLGGTSSQTSAGCLVPIISGRGSVGADIALTPAVYYQGRAFYSTTMGGQVADVPGNLVYSVNYMGGTHTYLSLAGAVTPYMGMVGSGSTVFPQVLWE